MAAPPAVAARAGEIASQLGLPGAPPVRLVPAPVPPMLWPTRGGPLLLLPQQLLGRLTADERDALLAHELAHVRRRDHWVRFVEIAATALFWWYPVAWWARAALRRAEERCCDEWVLRVLPAGAGAYASGLLKSLAFVSGEADPLPIGASGAGPVHDLEARLKEILMARPLPRLAAPVRLGLAAAALAGLAVFPTHAQSRPAVALGTMDGTAAVAAVAPSPAADTAPPIVAGPARARAVAPRDVRPVVSPSGIRGPIFRLVTPRPSVAAGGCRAESWGACRAVFRRTSSRSRRRTQTTRLSRRSGAPSTSNGASSASRRSTSSAARSTSRCGPNRSG